MSQMMYVINPVYFSRYKTKINNITFTYWDYLVESNLYLFSMTYNVLYMKMDYRVIGN